MENEQDKEAVKALEDLISFKSQGDLVSFVEHCLLHPTERFWQALRNWSEYNFILGSKESHFLSIPEGAVVMPKEIADFIAQLQDTFYLE